MHRTLLPYLSQLALALTVLTPKAVAQKDFCLPEAVGVPNLNGVSMWGAPIWWVPGGPTNMTRLDDPRWNGAVARDTNGEVSFRALHRTGTPDTLFLSWTTRIDLSITAANLSASTGDQLLVGFKQQDGTAVVIHLGLATSPLEASTNFGRAVRTWNGSGSPTPVNPLPSWISGPLRVWTWDDGTGKATWTFQMAVPIGVMPAGIDLNTTTKQFEMFYAFLVYMSSSIVEYDWGTPLDAGGKFSSVRDGTGAVSSPNPTVPWSKVSWGTSSNCAGDVALDANQIGVGDPPVNEIKFTYPPPPPTTNHNSVPNQLTAKPRNISGNTIEQGRIKADFFLSNYGSAIGDTRFWEKIPPAATSSTNIGQILPNDLGLIQPSPLFVVPDADRCKYIDDATICPSPPPGIWDQCILVQLSEVTPTTPSPALVFRNQSTYNNMLFRQASTLRHRAQISVVGLMPVQDGRTTRDVYLYVETVNMPARTSGDSKSAVTRTQDTLFVARRDTSLQLEWGVIRLARGDSLRIPLRLPLLDRGHSAAERFRAVKSAAASGKLTVPEVDAAVPTYRIHAYHATGDSLGKVPILEPQTSFGYWVEHDGEVIGWRHRIEGERIIQLAPNYYKIEVPNNGRTIITTIIEALPWRPFALSLHAGVSLPSANLKTTNDRGFGITADAEYWWSRRFAVQAFFGLHRFGGKGTNPDLELFHASAGLEARITTGSASLVIEGGGGTYHFKPGSTDPGTHVGASVEFDVSPRVSLGVNGRLHTVFTTGSNTTFYSVQAGGWIRL